MGQHESKALSAMAAQMERDLREIRERLRRPLEAEFAQAHLTGPQRSVMQAVFHSEGLSLKELSQRVGLDHSTVSGIVDRLSTRGMLARTENVEDRRFTRIVVTQEVRDFMAKRAPQLTGQPLVQALGTMSIAARADIQRSLRRLLQALGD